MVANGLHHLEPSAMLPQPGARFRTAASSATEWRDEAVARKAKQTRGSLRWYAHPEKEPIVDEGRVITPGSPIPDHLPRDLVAKWRRDDLLMPETIFKRYFAHIWNRMYPSEAVREVTLDPDVKTPDKMKPDTSFDDVGEVR